ncbi:hypothetical protein FA95DRAFT_1583281 [Auriscalpium vulgare]|uniref:Uncharacterized protein n=1 Tax=Auriscalpium vulgare TaxID=40419 RepID=A0ACB8RNW3_9AGAM|nr:hypothetical protein FA95DRAFT_1583281 [Auriscalpium vulgare]
MNTDPLSDTTAPRYAYESDEEEDEHNPLSQSSKGPAELDIKIIGLPEGSSSGGTLVVASGDAGKFWAAGANLGEQKGAAYVNSVSIGMLFQPLWTKATVVVSEATTLLPIWAMHPYSEAVFNFLKPATVVLLDSYAVPSYVTDRPLSYDDSPVRYLLTHGSTSPNPKYAPFEPPNLLQTTSAAFASIISRTPETSATILLLPSPNIPRPRKSELDSSDHPSSYDSDATWSPATLQDVHSTLFSDDPAQQWVDKGGRKTVAAARRTGDVGEGGMYM